MSWFKTLTSHRQTPQESQSSIDDAELLKELKAGSAKAVEQWYRQYSPQVRQLVASKVSIKADIDEMVQDTFKSCLKHLPLFRGDSSISTWMYRIARHEIADYYRRKYAKKAIRALPLADFLMVEKPHNAHETSERVKQVLRQLPAQYQELLLLKYVDKKRVKDISKQLGRSVKAIESDLFRARKAFKEEYSLAFSE